MKKENICKNKYIRTNSKKSIEILDILKNYYSDAKCGLNFDTPFSLTVALILAAQCTDARVNTITPIFFEKFKDIKDVSCATLQEIEEIIRPCGFYKTKARSIQNSAKIILSKYNGKVPDTMEELTTLPGIGRKSANIILQECFNKTQGIAVDTHVTRISRKLGFSNGNSQEKIEKELMMKFPQKYWSVINHVLVWHGRKICIARNPKCDICPVKDKCPKND